MSFGAPPRPRLCAGSRIQQSFQVDKSASMEALEQNEAVYSVTNHCMLHIRSFSSFFATERDLVSLTGNFHGHTT